MNQDIVDLELPYVGRCLRVDGVPEVVQALMQAMPSWPIKVSPPSSILPTRYIYRDATGLWQGSLHEANEFHLPSPASAACSLVGDLLSERLQTQPELLGLHCASVEINQRLVLFPESSKAGKSTLSVAFAAAGYRLFGDDVLGLTENGEGVAMGVAPRLRLPLPASFSAEFVDYANRYAGPEDDRYRFVLPKSGGLAHLDERCPIGAIVLLERDASITHPQVVTLPPAEGLLQLLCQNFAREAQTSILLQRLLPLMQSVPCLLLRYSEPLVGARYLAEVIKHPHLQNMNRASLIKVPPTAPTNEQDKIYVQKADSKWTASPSVTSYPLAEELFLIHNESGAIHRLNSSGKVAWQLLQQEAITAVELSEIIATHFQVPTATVNLDIAALLAILNQAELITQC
ncbi:PqqD family peptide modification chaperone [Oceanisphaera avium]|uniref:Serine kinase n=1 Tax=Oceanisphaera avium TaxID=1903694 RepID=A0A1Y0CZW7_9GAMM|nr:PqqD family peptide modification chaperone [Oceanisphaera avium]ART80873.1 hypothetical protein CBP12_12490 [Oceanisphaera avium]